MASKWTSASASTSSISSFFLESDDDDVLDAALSLVAPAAEVVPKILLGATAFELEKPPPKPPPKPEPELSFVLLVEAPHPVVALPPLLPQPLPPDAALEKDVLVLALLLLLRVI